MSDEQNLIESIARGDHKALEVLVRENQDFVFSVAMSQMKNYHESQEVAQDVFVKVFRSANTFRGDSSVRTWLYIITRRACLDRFKKRKVNIVDQSNLSSLSTERNKGEEELMKSDRQELIQNLLDQLSEKERDVMSLYYLKELSIDEVSEILGLTGSNVKIILFRARKKLRELTENISLKQSDQL
ncbi:MAG: sigma-70 family RNA polymerase sigma factor [Saprospiraceae bacterium]|nr:sigma-70 family RNA polymerase sigma factor [Saprospiraceae bacterium]